MLLIIAVLLLFISLYFLFFYKKKSAELLCQNCKRPLGDSKYSCSVCGYPLVNELYKEMKTEASSIVRLIVRDKKSFGKIKSLLLERYKKDGLKKVIIDEENAFLLKSENNAHVLATIKDYDLTIETFNIDKPNFYKYENLFILNKKGINSKKEFILS